MNKLKNSSGLSLLELLIALFLISLISSLLIQVYANHKRMYHVLENKLEQNMDVQWTKDLLSNSIRRAGFTPCLNIERLEVIDKRLLPRFVKNEAISVQQNTLQVNRMSEHFTELLAIYNPQQIVIASKYSIKKGGSILIADCVHAEIHQIKKIEKNNVFSKLTLSTPLYFSYPSITYIGKWEEETWFIKKNREGIPSLFFKLVRSEELSSLIHSLAVQKKPVGGKLVITLTLGLEQQQSQNVVVAVRS